MRKLTAIEKSNETFEEIAVQNLKRGDKFLFRKTQRVLREFGKLAMLEGDQIRKAHRGKALLITTDCKQTIMAPTDKVFIHKSK